VGVGEEGLEEQEGDGKSVSQVSDPEVDVVQLEGLRVDVSVVVEVLGQKVEGDAKELEGGDGELEVMSPPSSVGDSVSEDENQRGKEVKVESKKTLEEVVGSGDTLVAQGVGVQEGLDESHDGVAESGEGVLVSPSLSKDLKESVGSVRDGGSGGHSGVVVEPGTIETGVNEEGEGQEGDGESIPQRGGMDWGRVFLGRGRSLRRLSGGSSGSCSWCGRGLLLILLAHFG